MGRFGHDATYEIMLKGDNKGNECKVWIHDLTKSGRIRGNNPSKHEVET